MRVLIKPTDSNVSVHLADESGNNLCHVTLNRAKWILEERPAEGLTICRHCLLIQAQRTQTPGDHRRRLVEGKHTYGRWVWKAVRRGGSL